MKSRTIIFDIKKGRIANDKKTCLIKTSLITTSDWRLNRGKETENDERSNLLHNNAVLEDRVEFSLRDGRACASRTSLNLTIFTQMNYLICKSNISKLLTN